MSLNLEQVKSDLMNIYNIDSNIINDRLHFSYKGLSIVKSDFSSILIKDKILNDIDKKYIISEIKRYKSYNSDNSNYWNDDIENYQNILNNNKVDIILSCLCYSTNNIIQNLELYIFLEQKLDYSRIGLKFYKLYDKNIILNDYKAFLPTSTNKQEKKELNIEKIDIKELFNFVDSLKNQLKDYSNYKRYNNIDLDFYILDDMKKSRYFNIENIIKIIEYNLKYTKDKIKHSLELKLEKPLERNYDLSLKANEYSRQVFEYDLTFKPIKQDTKIMHDTIVKNNKIITHFSYDFVELKNADVQILNILDDQFLTKYSKELLCKDNDIENNNVLSITLYSNDKELNTLNLKLK